LKKKVNDNNKSIKKSILIRNLGLDKIDSLAHATKASDFCLEKGKRYFKPANAQGFTIGRRTDRLAAACLYIACRSEKSSHLLIDFSELLDVFFFAYIDSMISGHNTVFILYRLMYYNVEEQGLADIDDDDYYDAYD
jgi:transcription initiation factor TFIIIB Brf1 subunit/transcription initiation factor TFIIB